MANSLSYLRIVFFLICGGFIINGVSQPMFMPNQDPKPSGKTWEKIEDLSDEFNGSSLDAIKWQNTNPQRWRGRPPGIFKQDVVSLVDSNLRITCYQLASPEIVNGDTFTHAGGNLYSNFAGLPGYYFECRMKANKTFMSSTFWLINNRGDGSGCDVRTTELDIQECVGQVNTSANWAQSFDQSIHSNTHSRNTSCQTTPTGSEGGNSPTSLKVWADYHVYGAWWKSPTEIEFYLDGTKVYTVNPAAEFNLPMYLRLVSETYDWNPVPNDGGMTGTSEERTTYYDWVRSYKLVDDLSASSGTVEEKALRIFPNPANDGFLKVEFESISKPISITVRDVFGRLLQTQQVAGQETTISLDGIGGGFYFVELITDNKKYVRSFMVR